MVLLWMEFLNKSLIVKNWEIFLIKDISMEGFEYGGVGLVKIIFKVVEVRVVWRRNKV